MTLVSRPNPDLFDTRFVPPRGATSDIKLYIVGEAPGADEAEQRKPFVGIAGRCLDQMMADAGIDQSSVRIWNTIPYRPVTQTKTANRTPTDAEILEFSIVLKKDIEKFKPNTIICMGRSAAFGLGIEGPSVTKMIGPKFYYNDIPAYVAFHPSYINRTAPNKADWRSSPHYGTVVNALRTAYESGLENLPSKSDVIVPIIIDAFNPGELKRLTELFPDDEIEITTDYEASGLNTYNQKFHIAGIGFGSLSKPEKTAYVYFYDVSRHPSTHGPIPEESLYLIGDFLRKRIHVVYNAQYEASVSYSQFNQLRINFTDLLAWVRCISQSGTLKNVASRRLGIEVWNDDVDAWVTAMSLFQDSYNKMLKVKKCTYGAWSETNGDSFGSLIGYVNTKSDEEIKKQLKKANFIDESVLATFKFKGEDVNLFKFRLAEPELVKYLAETPDINLDTVRELAIDKNIIIPGRSCAGRYELICYQNAIILTATVKKYYSEDMVETILNDAFARVKMRISIGEFDINYADIPLNIVALYCCSDIVNTTKLYHDVKSELKEKNLIKAADYFNRQVSLGFDLELSGIAWDDQLATKLHKIYSEESLDSLRSLLLNEKFQQILELSETDKIEIATSTEIEKLKNFFNPGSNHITTRSKFSALVVTPRFKFAKMLHELDITTTQGREKDLVNKNPVLYPIYKCIVSAPMNERSALLAEHAAIWTTLIQEAKKHSNEAPEKITRYGKSNQDDDLRLLLQYENYVLDSLADEAIKEIYGLFVLFFGLDIEDRTTWPEEFWSIYYFRLNKKSLKVLNTYIEGDTGREKVFIVPVSAIKEKRLLEVAAWSDRPKTDDEIYIYHTSWNVNGARTSRWRSGIHTVPANSELQDLKISRYPNGIRLHSDYSQMELRILATMSNDKNFIAAFAAGKDIHRFVASKIWKLDENQVSKAQRRQAKECSFSLVYGKSVAAFAADFTKGNIEEAQYIFDSIYGEFPGIRDYIIESQYAGLESGYVTSIFGSIIDAEVPAWAKTLDPEIKRLVIEESGLFSKEFRLHTDRIEDWKMRKDLGKCLRNSVNYRIQSSASHIAALSIKEVVDFVNENSYYTRVDCFTHDSMDFDSPVTEMLDLIRMIPEKSVNWSKQEFGTVVSIDFEIGVSGNQMVGLKNPIVEGNRVTGGFHGKKNSIENLMKKFDETGVKYKFEVEEKEEEHLGLSDLFIGKQVFSLDIGRTFEIHSGKVELIF